MSQMAWHKHTASASCKISSEFSSLKIQFLIRNFSKKFRLGRPVIDEIGESDVARRGDLVGDADSVERPGRIGREFLRHQGRDERSLAHAHVA